MYELRINLNMNSNLLVHSLIIICIVKLHDIHPYACAYIDQISIRSHAVTS